LTLIKHEEIGSRVLKGGRVVSVIHKGPYETIGNAYKKLFGYINSNGLKVTGPSREIYLKGPGLILPRSPKKFITELQMVYK
jgi:Transcriptional regulator, effector-binding domain/component